ncbi:23S rRNA (guanosine(2251)-2'-O)-methyltransferase RlmB [Tenericutes bacterium MZ-XQ]|jgi:predicted rRNA methylase|nr:23S rRNA (guanosine(2251)-2'-O)-methyltransferase RlmB [Tenericutes bacterium MZ-XQ]
MIVYGKNVIKEAVFSSRPIFNLYIDQKFSDYKFLTFLEDKGIRYEKVSKEKLSSLAGSTVHQGIVANVKDYETYELKPILDQSQRQKFIILDGIEDPHNLGAIMRTAEATNLTGIIMSKKGQVPLNQTVAKVSSGAIEHVKVILVSNINQAIEILKQHRVLVVGTDGNTNQTYDDIPKDQSIAVVMGNEGSGMRPLVKKHCDLLVKIPMYGKINSLNVSVAAALMMYKIL